MSVEVEERTRALAFSDCPRPVGCAGSNQSKMPVFQLIPGYSSLCRGGRGVSNGEFYTALRQNIRRTIILPLPATNALCCGSRNLGSAGRIRLPQSPISNQKFLSSGYCRLLSPLAAYFLNLFQQPPNERGVKFFDFMPPDASRISNLDFISLARSGRALLSCFPADRLVRPITCKTI